jgi:hypothetical protein
MLTKVIYVIGFFLIYFKITYGQDKAYPILIIGGGASGISAGLHAARADVKTLIIEESLWLGGMLTSAGVSAFDGNHRLAGGIWKELRDSLYNHYGSTKAVETGWVSNTLFEPSIGNRIFKNMAAKVEKLDILYGSYFVSATKKEDIWEVVINSQGILDVYNCHIIIDATETGEVCKYLDIESDIGMESKLLTGEFGAGDQENDIIQDITYVAILKDYGKGVDKTIIKPDGYNIDEFKCCCDTRDPSTLEKAHIDCDKMMTYGKLPNGKYMINWPNCGNDIYINTVNDDRETRIRRVKEAKLHTLRFVYYIQHELGYKHLGLADDEYPTDDLLPFFPYHRESRRIIGHARLQTEHLVKPFDQKQKYFMAGIAVGDYPIDHHHKKNPEAPSIDFINIKVPSYNIPLGSLIPVATDGLIVAEKSISVSNIVNGATRLQPVVLGIGQAAGALAIQAIIDKVEVSNVSIRKVQQQLLNVGAYIMPYIDVKPTDKYFLEIQRIGASGIITGIGINYKWANQTWFYPNKTISEYELLEGLKTVYPLLKGRRDGSGEDLKIAYLLDLLKSIKPKITKADMVQLLKKNGFKKINENIVLKRVDVAFILDHLLDPFSIGINHDGHFINQKSTIE